MSGMSKVSQLVQRTGKSKSQIDEELVAFNVIEISRNNCVKKIYDRMYNCFTGFFMYPNQLFDAVQCYGQMLIRSFSI